MAHQEPQVSYMKRYGEPTEAPPPYYRPLAIVSIFFCPLLGLLAIVMSFVTERRYEEGDIMRAEHASRDTKFSAIVGIAFGVIIALYLIFLFEIVPHFA